MGICARELRLFVVRPTLKHLTMWSPAAENLLLGTAAVESGLGFHLKQEKHSALGIFQVSPKMHHNIWDHYLADKPDLSSLVRGLASQREFLTHPHLELATNLSYSAAIAWLVYERTGKPIVNMPADDFLGFGKLWHNHYHRHNQRPAQHFVDAFETLILKEEPATLSPH